MVAFEVYLSKTHGILLLEFFAAPGVYLENSQKVYIDILIKILLKLLYKIVHIPNIDFQDPHSSRT